MTYMGSSSRVESLRGNGQVGRPSRFEELMSLSEEEAGLPWRSKGPSIESGINLGAEKS
jgi:hypothetical protein